MYTYKRIIFLRKRLQYGFIRCIIEIVESNNAQTVKRKKNMPIIEFMYKGYQVVLSDVIQVDGVNIGSIDQNALLSDIQGAIDTYIECLNS
jgi:hypothetical protein